ncbi:MAG: hypothetical protein ACP5GC_06960 [Thiomonas sp.]|jgi:hypothetical protein
MTTPTPSQLLHDYQALRQGLLRSRAAEDLPPMRPAGLQQTQQDFAQPDALWAAFSAHRPTQGWVQFQSHQTGFDGALPSPLPHWGWLLQAEAVTAEGLNLAVSRLPSGAWSLLERRHLDTGDWLCDELEHCAHDPRLGALRYRRYWALDPTLGPVQTAACFIGFAHNHTQGA